MVCLLALAVVGLSIPTRPIGNEWTECQGNLTQIGQAVQKWSNDHGKRYPSTLQQLVPFYLPSLPTCRYSDQDDSYSASYRSTVNRACFGFACLEGHKSPVLGLPSSTFFSSHVVGRATERVAACSERLRKIAREVAYFRSVEGKLPAEYSNLAGTSFDPKATRRVAIQPTTEADYEVICLEPHLDEGLALLQPRFDSRSQEVSARVLRRDRIPRPARAPLWPTPLVALLVALWVFYRRWHQERTVTLRNPAGTIQRLLACKAQRPYLAAPGDPNSGFEPTSVKSRDTHAKNCRSDRFPKSPPGNSEQISLSKSSIEVFDEAASGQAPVAGL